MSDCECILYVTVVPQWSDIEQTYENVVCMHVWLYFYWSSSVLASSSSFTLHVSYYFCIFLRTIHTYDAQHTNCILSRRDKSIYVWVYREKKNLVLDNKCCCIQHLVWSCNMLTCTLGRGRGAYNICLVHLWKC